MKKLYIIAGERSGDLHGSNLVKSLLSRDRNLSIRGFGGDEMKKAGVDIFVHYDRLAFMGFVALLTNARTIFRYIKLCKQDILQVKPEAIILIDYGGFNRKIAKFGKQQGIKIFYYIPPKVWAWYQKRAFELKQNVDKLFVILPFEKKFFKEKCNWDVDYVGNPVLDAIKSFKPNPDFLIKEGIDQSKKIVALLPGSRKMELKRIIPLMAEVVRKYPELQFVVAAVKNLPGELYKEIENYSNVKLVFDASYELLHVAQAAMVTSGTATLETAIFNVPQVVVYKTGRLEYLIAASVVKVEYISLVNLIAGKKVVKELIQREARLNSVGEELSRLVYDESYRKEMMTAYNLIYKTLDTGSASENTAGLMLEYLK
ncbi:MAG: lipid-A-disaccharide synthase [Cytophagales bacterium]|jgi:lipid-A-disaccharide synthase|nr:lipid-A-disaccharide synthase [Bacteroidota bacterium]MBS1982389.1 lipid-A-disaccharide synthase [Bacteroidota bacterium]WHZ06679.1 MAG: lipid-A-disaccharide synthase [Cytophagales bacterium]